MTTPLFAGNQLQDFINTLLGSEVTTAGHFDSAWVPNAIHIASGTTPVQTPVHASQTDLWIHWEGFNTDGNSTLEPFFFAYDNTGTAKVRLLATSGTPVATSLQYWTGAAWSTIGTGSFTAATKHQHDIHIVVNGASSSINWYVDGALLVTASGDFSSITNIAQEGWACHRLNGSCDISQVIVTTVNTLNRRNNLRLPSANGANTGFTGAYTDINAAITNTASFIYSGAAGNISTFPTAGKDLTGYAVDAVITTNMSQTTDATGPQHEQWCLRIGGTNYLSGVNVAVAIGWNSYRSYLTTNPATGLGWTPADAGDATMEVGLESTA